LIKETTRVTDESDEVLSRVEDGVGFVTLNRPKAINSLNQDMVDELRAVLSHLGFADVFDGDFFAPWAKLAAVRTPTIAAVAGHALGGGCQLAMICDVAT
jgi:enoyl-CoA hydratase